MALTRRQAAATLSVLLGAASTGLGQLSPGQPPADYADLIYRKALSDEAFVAQKYLCEGPEAAKGVPAILEAYERSVQKGRGQAQALLAGAAIANGDRGLIQPALDMLTGGDDDLRARVLAPLAAAPPIPEVHARIDEIVEKSGAAVRPQAQAVKAAWDAKTAGSGVGTLFALIGLCLAAGVGWVAKLASNVDLLKGKVIDWTANPLGRDAALKELKAQPEPVLPKLIGYFEKGLTPSEVAGLVDMISNWDEPASHEQIRKYTSARHDLVKGAAVLARANFAGDQWEAELVQLLKDGDDTQSGAAAKALAERKAIQHIDAIRAKHDAAVGPVKDLFRDALERLAPKS